MKRDVLPVLGASPATTRSPYAMSWRSALSALAVALAIEIAGYWQTAAEIVSIWARSTTFTHGFTVLPIVAWLVWRKRKELRAINPTPAPVVLPLIALAGFGWLGGDFVSVNAASQFALVGMLVVTVVAVLGVEVARAILFPLGFAFFAVPVGDFLLPVLMDWTADFTVAALRMTGIPVYREGFLIVVPNGRWSIVEACSGVRYLIASLMVGTLFAYLHYRAHWRRWVFVAFSAVVPIIANWVRAYLVILLGYLSNNRLAAGVDHIIYGWVFFGIVMLLMFGIGSRWHEPAPRSVPGAKAPAASHLPLVHAGLRRFGVAAVAAVAIALAWPLVDAVTQVPRGPVAPLTLNAVPGWHAVDGNKAPVRLDRASASFHQLFERDGQVVGAALAYYQAQDSRRKLARISGELFADEGQGWIRTVVGQRTPRIGGDLHTVLETHAQTPGSRMVVEWEWYWIDGSVTSSNVMSKLLVGWSRLSHRRDNAAAVLLYTHDSGDGHGARTLQQFAHDAWPAIEAALRQRAGSVE